MNVPVVCVCCCLLSLFANFAYGVRAPRGRGPRSPRRRFVPAPASSRARAPASPLAAQPRPPRVRMEPRMGCPEPAPLPNGLSEAFAEAPPELGGSLAAYSNESLPPEAVATDSCSVRMDVGALHAEGEGAVCVPLSTTPHKQTSAPPCWQPFVGDV